MKQSYWLFAIFLMAACSGRIIHIDMVQGIDFQAYKTYAWLMPTEAHLSNNILNENVHHYVNREMHQMGFVADSVHPDLLLDYTIHIQEQEIITLQPAYPVNPLPRPLWHPGATFREHLPMLKSYEEGVFAIDVFDRKNNKHIWSGRSVEPMHKEI
jgi:hypothetical protein